MNSPQAGIFALGNLRARLPGVRHPRPEKARGICSRNLACIREPRTTTGGVNFVIGFRPELWRELVPADAPPNLAGFNKPIQGIEGFVMPATQHDALVWLSGSAYDVLFDMARTIVTDLAGLASLSRRNLQLALPPRSRSDRLHRRLGKSYTPRRARRRAAPAGVPGAAGSVLLLQKWKHNVEEWEALPVASRSASWAAPNSTASSLKKARGLPCRPHRPGRLRQNLPPQHALGQREDHGTMFVGFCAAQQPLARMLESMAGLVTRHARRPHSLHPAIDRLLLLCTVRREFAALARRPGSGLKSIPSALQAALATTVIERFDVLAPSSCGRHERSGSRSRSPRKFS